MSDVPANVNKVATIFQVIQVLWGLIIGLITIWILSFLYSCHQELNKSQYCATHNSITVRDINGKFERCMPTKEFLEQQ